MPLCLGLNLRVIISLMGNHLQICIKVAFYLRLGCSPIHELSLLNLGKVRRRLSEHFPDIVGVRVVGERAIADSLVCIFLIR